MAMPTNFRFAEADTGIKPDVIRCIEALQNPLTREDALKQLSKSQSDHAIYLDMPVRDNLAPLLWNSFGTITILLQEIISVYHLLSTPLLTQKVAKRVCNALALLQSVAIHPDTKPLLIRAKIPLYLHPLLKTSNIDKSHEYLRLTSLGVIGSLIKHDDEQALQFILKTETFPYFLHCMEIGTELTKTVATYILNRVLSHDDGLKYCCVLADRFFIIGRALGNMFEKLLQSGRLIREEGNLEQESSKRLLKHIIWCYHKLSERARACDGFRLCLPAKLSDSRVIDAIRDDPDTTGPYLQLYRNVADGFISTTQRNGLTTRSASSLPRLIRS
ncbi:CCR4-NOT transcription complex subunit 9 [Euphorbia peplus]|nr:CCR4-NOT transcription complex subunit 9 [Euphorbia peplus]